MTITWVYDLRFFVLVVCGACAAAGMLAGYALRGHSQEQVATIENYNDCLVHPETTTEVKWVKMTKPTRDALVEIYSLHIDECSRYQRENDRVTIGEAAILWLIEKRESGNEH